MWNFKKVIAYLLIFFISINFVLCNIKIKKVWAAQNNFVAFFNKTLQEGVTNPIPIEQNLLSPKDQVLIAWDFDKMENQLMSHGEYELSYFLDNNVLAKLKVIRENEKATVDFNIFNATITNKSQKIINETPIVPGSYQIYTNIGKTYKNSVQFINEGYNGNDPLYKVESDIYPIFTIKENYGFSFKYYGRTFHFKWNAADNKFYFCIDRIIGGRVYNFDLKYKDNSNIDGSLSKKILSGISSNSVRAIPIANNNNSVDYNLDIDLDLKSKLDLQPLDLSTQNTENLPGSQNIELILRFDIPKELDDLDLSYSKIPNNYKLPIIIKLDNVNPSKEMQIIIDDLFSAPDISNISISTGATIKSVNKIGVNQERFEIILQDLEAGLLYDNISFSPISNQDIFANKIVLNPPPIFTFLKYDIISQGDDFFIRVYPYKGYSGYYMLKSGQPLESSVTQFSDGKENLLLPITLNAQNQQTQYYQIFFKRDASFVNSDTKDAVYSQIIKFNASNENTSIEIPSNFQILEGYTLESAKSLQNPNLAILNMTARWEIANKNLIDNLVQSFKPEPLLIKYELYNSLTPSPQNAKLFETVTLKIFEEDNQLYVEYIDVLGQITNTQKQKLQLYSDPNTNKMTYLSTIDFEIEVFYRFDTDIDISDINFFYPNIYFINAKTISINDKILDTSPCLYDSITLEDLTGRDLESPFNFKSYDAITTSQLTNDPIDETSFKISFDLPGAKIKEYAENVLKASSDFLNVYLDVYICEDEDFMKKEFFKFNLKDRVSNSVPIEYLEEYNNIFYFSNINKNQAMQIDNYEDPRQALRSKKVVRISNIDLNSIQKELVFKYGAAVPFWYKLDGLDQNRFYYIYIDYVIEQMDINMDLKFYKESALSNLESILTKPDKYLQDYFTQIPAAPILEKEDISSNSITVGWQEIESFDENAKPEKIEFEIIRTQDLQVELEKDTFSFDTKLEDIFDSIDFEQKVAFKTDDDKLYLYKNKSFIFADKDKYLYQRDPQIDAVKFKNFDVFPNHIYFYYVRTVRIVNNKKYYSVWSNISITTTPIEAPKNLKIVQDKIKYNKKTEFVIEFDAPFSDIKKLGNEYFIQYAIRESDFDYSLPLTMNINRLINFHEASPLEGHIRFYYKISFLKPDTNYEIKVRLINKNKDISMYSNIAYVKTDFDQNLYDKENLQQDFLEYLRTELEKIKKTYYYTLKDDDNVFRIFYRPTMIDSLIEELSEKTIMLPSTDSKEKIYYFSSEIIQKLNENKIGLRLKYQNTEILLDNNFINQNIDPSIKYVKSLIRKNNFKDYYVKFYCDFGEFDQNTININPISKQMHIKFDVIGTKVLATTFDNMIYEFISNKIKNDLKNPSIRIRILRYIDEKVENEIIIVILKNILKNIKQSYYDATNSIFFRTIVDRGYSILKLRSNMLVLLENQNNMYNIKAFKKNNNWWNTINIINFGDKKAFDTRDLGYFIFGGHKFSNQIFGNKDDLEIYKNIIIKYDLLDYFGINASSKDIITKNMVVGSIAKLLGLEKKQDPYKYLNDIGFEISNNNEYYKISLQDTLFLIMKLYEFRTNTNISNIFVRNNNIFLDKQNIIEDRNIQSLKAAHETQIFKDPNIDPNKKVNLEELLNMLLKIENI